MMAEEDPYCKCKTPECKKCGLTIRGSGGNDEGCDGPDITEIRDITELETVVCDGLMNIIDTPHISRGCSRLYNSYLKEFGGSNKELSEITTNRGKIHYLCSNVGLYDVAPLIELLKMLDIHNEDGFRLDKSLKRLEAHRAMTRSTLVACHECTAPSEVLPGYNKSSFVGYGEGRIGIQVITYALYTDDKPPRPLAPKDAS